MKIFVRLTLTILAVFQITNSNAQVIRSEHASPQAGNDYAGSTTSGCAPCTITDPEKAADSSLTNYAVVAASGSSTARAKLKVKLSDTATSGAKAGIAMKRTGSANPAVLNKITINTYYNNTLQESKTGSGLTTFLLNATSGIRAIEFTSTKKFNKVEVEVHKLGGGINSVDLFYGYGEDPGPLPVELVSFDAFIENDYVRINWVTASEYNNQYFIVENSNDGIGFHELDVIKTNTGSSNLKHYSTIDFSPAETSYYRLASVDKNDQRVYSKLVKVCQPKEEETTIAVDTYPNPTTTFITVNAHYLPDDCSLEIRALDGSLKSKYPEIKGGMNSFNIEELEAGNYLVLIISKAKGVVHSERILKL